MKKLFITIKLFFLKYFNNRKYIKELYKNTDLFNRFNDLTNDEYLMLNKMEQDKNLVVCKGRGVGSTTMFLYKILKDIVEKDNHNVIILTKTKQESWFICNQLFRIIENNENLKNVIKHKNQNLILMDKNDNNGERIKIMFKTYDDLMNGDLKGYYFSSLDVYCDEMLGLGPDKVGRVMLSLLNLSKYSTVKCKCIFEVDKNDNNYYDILNKVTHHLDYFVKYQVIEVEDTIEELKIHKNNN